MGEVLSELFAHFNLPPNAEFTSEANPGTLTDEWLSTLTRAGMNRLSLGVQAMPAAPSVAGFGRIHTFPEAMDAVAMRGGTISSM